MDLYLFWKFPIKTYHNSNSDQRFFNSAHISMEYQDSKNITFYETNR